MTNGALEVLMNISDGNQQSVACYRFSAASPEYTVLPDPHFFRDHGYAETDLFAAQRAPAWDQRRDDIIWRGALNGTGHFSLEPWAEDNPGVIQRLRMAQKCKALNVDFKFVSDPRRNENGVLQKAGLTGDFIPTHNWGAMKYAIDIDGFTNAWCNLLQRLKLGCCVLKVASPFGYRQWYYDRLIPWVHFVPISADLSDLRERIDWVKTHQAEAAEIARKGQILAKGLTFESETDFAVRAIEERERRA
ncbi:glycosyl transferase family 90 [Loktanella sp. 5RATIMAR09]|uniref:glycosyl transferase family 90 n=1 Tax=Loktanella sp. 5RATIMAR09 TaxID=1225655 RepID=UPI0006EB5A05|nr:glycosyl transferase family 90 [Loktanella sp. 5RATIMAR09]